MNETTTPPETPAEKRYATFVFLGIKRIKPEGKKKKEELFQIWLEVSGDLASWREQYMGRGENSTSLYSPKNMPHCRPGSIYRFESPKPGSIYPSKKSYVGFWPDEAQATECDPTWVLYVVEYKRGAKRQKAASSWEKEPGYVLEYESNNKMYLSITGVDNDKVENSWLYLEKINRFLEMVNPCCTALGINLYEAPYV